MFFKVIGGITLFALVTFVIYKVYKYNKLLSKLNVPNTNHFGHYTCKVRTSKRRFRHLTPKSTAQPISSSLPKSKSKRLSNVKNQGGVLFGIEESVGFAVKG